MTEQVLAGIAIVLIVGGFIFGIYVGIKAERGDW